MITAYRVCLVLLAGIGAMSIIQKPLHPDAVLQVCGVLTIVGVACAAAAKR